MADQSDVVSIPQLDLNRYLGKWYEICRLPLKWEDETATDITARYSINEAGNVQVDNRCFDAEGKPTQSIGEATTVSGTTSQLKVTFLPEFIRWIPFTDGDYWVLKLAPDYSVSLVGTPDRKNLWLLSRQPQLPQAVVADYLGEARRQGFDLTGLITPRPTGREVSQDMLE